jgi:hypothetical protein
MRTKWFFLLAALLAFGCGSGGYKVAPVSGQVTLDGKPLEKGKITFQPIGEGTITPGPGSYGTTNEKGEFSLRVVGTDATGAVVGKHQVRISKFTREFNPRDDRERPPPDIIPAKYNLDSKIEFEVPRGGTKVANFELTTH